MIKQNNQNALFAASSNTGNKPVSVTTVIRGEQVSRAVHATHIDCRIGTAIYYMCVEPAKPWCFAMLLVIPLPERMWTPLLIAWLSICRLLL